jgi:hypothetical protein
MAGEVYRLPRNLRNVRSDVLIALAGTLVLAILLFRMASYAPVPPAQVPSGSLTDLALGSVTVEILAMDDPALRPAMTQVDRVLAAYGNHLRVVHYDAHSLAGASFARAKGLSADVPLVIFVNGTQTFSVGGRQVTFQTLRDEQPASTWDATELDAVLHQVTAR